MAGTVLVTGGSGYIAGFLIKQLLDQGWRVHTTVRNPAREAALRDEAGTALDATLRQHGAPTREIKAQPIRWMPRVTKQTH
jgi:uncharacterized protein YbjT (DUF2867 family)